MIDLKLVLLFCAFSSLIQAQQRDLPKYIDKCSLKHEFKQCVLKSAIKAIPLIVKGDPEYKIPNMQPLHVPFVNLFNTPQIVLNFTDTKVYGLENCKMVDLVVNNEDPLSFAATFENHNITLRGEYSISGTILALPLKGDGLYSISLLNGVYKYPLIIEKVNNNGNDYYQTKGKALYFDFEDVIFDLGTIFNGDPEVGKQVNKLLGENWKDLLEEFRPSISDIVTNIISEIFNRIAKNVPVKNVFLPD